MAGKADEGKVDGSVLAGGLIVAAMLDVLVEKGVFNVDDARKVLDTALRAIGPDINTDHGAAAAQIIEKIRWMHGLKFFVRASNSEDRGNASIDVGH